MNENIYRVNDVPSKEEWTTIIKPKNGWFDFHTKELLQYKDLIFMFVRRTFIAQFKQTILGPAWAIIQPLLTTIVFTLIFGNVAKLAKNTGVPTFIFYLSGSIMWTYFSSCLTSTANIFVENRAILGKVYFPRLVMPVSSVISNMITLGIQFVFMLIFIVYYAIAGMGVVPNLYILITPLLFIQLAVLSLGVGIIISALTTKYRDLAMLIVFGVQIWMYASPIAYDMFDLVSFAPGGKYHALYMMNPVTPIINVFRYAFLGIGEIEWLFYGIGWVITVVILMFGMMMFSRVEKNFMDTI